jgi:nickel-dependent lactate racemase
VDIRLAYGKTDLLVTFPDDWDITIIEPEYIPGISHPDRALREALQAPCSSPALHDLVHPGDRVGIVFSDITRPTPNHLLLPAVLAELAHIPESDITLFNALGTHRPNSEIELRKMLGDELISRYRIIQNNAFDPSTQVCLGSSTYGNEIWLNRELANCDLKILTGFIEPHFFAGFSGHGKAVMPGMSSLTTILGNHNAAMIADPKSTWGITHGNPIWEEIRQAAHLCGKIFLLNVTLNRDKQITGIFAGDIDRAHEQGCAYARKTAMRPVSEPFDIVITSNSGYPLDLNLYQSVKGMSAAAQVVRQGGAIIIAADCWDGIPDHGFYRQLLQSVKDPRQLLETICQPGFLKQDQWQAQIQAQIQLKAEVYLYTKNLSAQQIGSALLKPCENIQLTLEQLMMRFGSQARICILPEGPQTIPYINVSTG